MQSMIFKISGKTQKPKEEEDEVQELRKSWLEEDLGGTIEEKSRKLTQFLANHRDALGNDEQVTKDQEIAQEEIRKFAEQLPKPPGGKRRFIDYFIEVKKKGNIIKQKTMMGLIDKTQF